jgi:hypothetical protein
MQGSEKIIQPMIFPPDHPKFPNTLKGMKEVLKEWGIETKTYGWSARNQNACQMQKLAAHRTS